MAVRLHRVGKHRVEVEEALMEPRHVVIVLLRADETMVENVRGVGIGAEDALKLVFLLAVDDAVFHLHVERIIEVLVVGVDGTVGH